MPENKIRILKLKNDFISGFKDQFPLYVGVIPFGLVFGAYAISIGLTPFQAISFSILINAGSSQIAALGLLVQGVNPFLIIFSIALINLRFILYRASWAIYMTTLKKPFKIWLSYWLTDATFLLILKKYQSSKSGDNLNYSLGVGFGQWSAWELSCVVGIALGPLIPSSLSLGFALPLLFITLLMGHLISLPMVVSGITSGILAVLLINIPNNLGLLFSILLGIIAGLLVEGKKDIKMSLPTS
jgi:predicted branched-subunit amino acid permease